VLAQKTMNPDSIPFQPRVHKLAATAPVFQPQSSTTPSLVNAVNAPVFVSSVSNVPAIVAVAPVAAVDSTSNVPALEHPILGVPLPISSPEYVYCVETMFRLAGASKMRWPVAQPRDAFSVSTIAQVDINTYSVAAIPEVRHQ
jgi:hypothetical protein